MNKTEYIDLFEKYIRAEASPEEILILVAYIEHDERIARWIESSIARSEDGLDALRKQELFNALMADISVSTPQKKPSRLVPLAIWRIAAVGLLLLATSLITYFAVRPSEKQAGGFVVSVETGQKSRVELPDGSVAWINSQSSLRCADDFNRRDRRLYLSGEAYFEVAKNADRPFIVCVEDMAVRALGTAFDVKGYPQDKEVLVTLFSGKVEVSTPESRSLLLPNDQLVFNKVRRKATVRSLDMASGFMAWRDDVLYFDNEKLVDICNTLERAYNIKVVFESELIKEYRITGSVKNNSLESVFSTFSLSSPILFTMQDTVITLRENEKLTPYYKIKK